VVEVASGQQHKAVLDGGHALLLVLVLADVFLQRFDDDPPRPRLT
jgi:hypothetical protein